MSPWTGLFAILGLLIGFIFYIALKLMDIASEIENIAVFLRNNCKCEDKKTDAAKKDAEK